MSPTHSGEPAPAISPSWGPARPAVPVALTTAASLLGDTLLYTALPVNATRLGLGPVAIGLALSLNRWVRLATNPVAARLYERLPAGLLVVAAIALASLTTALYAIPAALIAFFAARLAWGFCWSLLRLGSFLSTLDAAPVRAGRKLGEMRAIIALGYLAGVVYAPVAIELWGWEAAALGAAALTLALGLPMALLAVGWRRSLHVIDPAQIAPVGGLLALFVAGAIGQALHSGLLLVAGGLRVAELFPAGGAVGPLLVAPTLLAGVYVFSRRFAEVFLQPVVGRLADRSAHATFLAGSLAALAGIAALALPVDALAFLLAGALAFTGGVGSAIAIELAIARRCDDSNRARVLATYATWTDAGAAAGALAGGTLALLGTAAALAIGAALVTLTFPLWWTTRRRARRGEPMRARGVAERSSR